MLRSFVQKCVRLQPALSNTVRRNISTTTVRLSHHQQETDEEFDKRYVDYLSNPNITGWEIRKAMNDLCGEDLVPDPKIVIALMKACRQVNDYALAVRILESCKDKAGKAVDKIWPYMVQELTPTVQELGINFPEELGYDKPELACEDVNDIH